MVADDDPAIVDSIKLMLEISGYEVVTSVDASILEVLNYELPNLLLLDIWMSGIDGRKICKKIKATERTKYIPVVLVSASKDVRKSAQESGADAFLAKPFEMDDLLALVEKFAH